MAAAALNRTVAVLGASYGGARAAQLLAGALPDGWRVVVIDRNSHLNHLYVLPRYAVVPGHEHKAFIPYTNIFQSPNGKENPGHIFLHAQVTGLSPRSVTLSRAFPEHGIQGPTPTLQFDYLLYSLGSHLPAPINLWGPVDDIYGSVVSQNASRDRQVSEPSSSYNTSLGIPPSAPVAPLTQGTKVEGIQWIKRYHERIESASSVLVVGGGALGIQYATDVADAYPTKRVTLLHSRAQLLPRFDEGMHKEILARLSALNVDTILGERLDLSSLTNGQAVRGENDSIERVVRTQNGRQIRAELIVLCTGQIPNTNLFGKMLPDAIVPDGPSKGMIRVQRTMQVALASKEHVPGGVSPQLSVPYPHLFAIGDAADAFGAIKSGRSAHSQCEVAVRNIVKLIARSEGREGDSALESYAPDPPAIKVSLGLDRGVYQMHGKIVTVAEAQVDMEAHRMWQMYGAETDEEGMHL
ncbi:iron uptake cluster protein [Sparassis latifolia]|uniref:Hypothetical iron uptake cluster protein n=1 Tax=Sparassis crispa TaxID=139825 RepID=A0A401GUU1_9APHY|nr:hypothetical iron uptake cluster protein [Sparassis crispa]GBE85966.1 hypothetical iron uptake cluster protein [Sparassis crispa]